MMATSPADLADALAADFTAQVGEVPARHEMRFNCDAPDEVAMWTNRLAVEIADESFSGMGFVLTENPGVNAGDTAVIGYGNRCAEALIRNVTPLSDGRWRVGVQWKQPGGPFATPGAKKAGG